MKKRYNISIEEEVKVAFEEEVSKMGLSMSSAIEIFMRAVVGQHCIPFSVGSYDHAVVELPTETTPAPESEVAPEAERKVERAGKKNKGKKKK